MTFSVHACRSLVPSTSCSRYVVVDLKAPPRRQDVQRAPVHVALVIDRSGSMARGKLELAVEATKRAVQTLAADDRFSIVAFDDDVQLVVPSTRATADAKRNAVGLLDGLRTGGSTDLGAGWLSGAEQAALALTPDAIARCIVLTDGQANRGIVAPGELGEHARALRVRRVTTSTVGLGDGFNEFLLGRLSEEGGGSFHYARQAEDLSSIFTSELGDVFSITARDVGLVVDAPEGAVVESLNGHRRDDGTFVVGSLVGEQAVRAVFRIEFPSATGATASNVGVRVGVRDADGVFAAQGRDLAWRRADDAACRVERPTDDMVIAVATLEEAGALRIALELNQDRDYEDARIVIDAAIARLCALAPGHAAVDEAVERLQRARDRYGRPMSSKHSKEEFAHSFGTLKGRRTLRPVHTDDDDDRRGPALDRRGLHLYVGSTALMHAAERARSVLHGPSLEVADVRLYTAGNVARAPSPLRAQLEERALRLLRTRAPGMAMLVVEQELEDRWFSHWHADARVVVVSTAGFVEMTGLPLEAFLAYEMLLHAPSMRSARYDPHALVHDEHRGCLFDFCRDKAEIAVKLQVGHICDHCVRGLTAVDVDPAALLAQWQTVQELAHPR